MKIGPWFKVKGFFWVAVVWGQFGVRSLSLPFWISVSFLGFWVCALLFTVHNINLVLLFPIPISLIQLGLAVRKAGPTLSFPVCSFRYLGFDTIYRWHLSYTTSFKGSNFYYVCYGIVKDSTFLMEFFDAVFIWRLLPQTRLPSMMDGSVSSDIRGDIERLSFACVA